MFLVGGQRGELLQEWWGGWGGDVQEVLKGLVDGAGGDAALICPVTDHPFEGEMGKQEGDAAVILGH